MADLHCSMKPYQTLSAQAEIQGRLQAALLGPWDLLGAAVCVFGSAYLRLLKVKKAPSSSTVRPRKNSVSWAPTRPASCEGSADAMHRTPAARSHPQQRKT